MPACLKERIPLKECAHSAQERSSRAAVRHRPGADLMAPPLRMTPQAWARLQSLPAFFQQSSGGELRTRLFVLLWRRECCETLPGAPACLPRLAAEGAPPPTTSENLGFEVQEKQQRCRTSHPLLILAAPQPHFWRRKVEPHPPQAARPQL